MIKPTDAFEEALVEDLQTPHNLQHLPTDKYIVFGSLSTPYAEPSEDISYILNEDDNNFDIEILNCGFIIYDITKKPAEIPKALKTLSLLISQLENVKEIGPKTYENFNKTKVFILISTVMTWAWTKPLDPVMF